MNAISVQVKTCPKSVNFLLFMKEKLIIRAHCHLETNCGAKVLMALKLFVKLMYPFAVCQNISHVIWFDKQVDNFSATDTRFWRNVFENRVPWSCQYCLEHDIWRLQLFHCLLKRKSVRNNQRKKLGRFCVYLFSGQLSFSCSDVTLAELHVDQFYDVGVQIDSYGRKSETKSLNFKNSESALDNFPSLLNSQKLFTPILIYSYHTKQD